MTIDAFDLLKVIGKGSFGKVRHSPQPSITSRFPPLTPSRLCPQVMQVRKKDTGRIYALKTLRKAHIVSRSEVTHTLAERTVLAQVNNPFIVPLKFSFQSKDKLYLCLSFINGGELFHHLQREGRFNEERSRFYAAELLCALEHLHQFNVIYRDLKPENILIDYVGHIALCDFGLCKLNMSESETTNSKSYSSVRSGWWQMLTRLGLCSFLRHARIPRARAAAWTRLPEDRRLVDAGRVALRNAFGPAAVLLGEHERDVPKGELPTPFLPLYLTSR